ncbi:MAG: TVP38/TMEM64 family protein, partial [Clostridia bacterium]|nr:TVP38/TMEM64 family protein [Clostridia bacterium]
MKLRFSLKSLLLSVSLCLLSGITILVSVLYVNTFTGGFFYENKPLLISSVTIVVAIITTIALAYATADKKTVYKVSLVVLALISFSLLVMYFLKISGVGDKIDSVEDLRNYVASFGYLAIVIYVIVNILQVVLLPIPGFISVGTGVALFGPLKTAVFSLLGILIGSFMAFFIGKVLGYRVVKWIVGKETLDKWLNSVKNKDKIILTFMFLFPFFPDDVLCFVAGLSSMSTGYFVIMITVCRVISVFLSAYSLNGNIIPYNTWWGIVLWIIVIALTVIATV